MKKYKNDERLYGVWSNIKQRCFNPKNHAFKYYGARGITMCDEWLKSYETFQDWAIANGYDENAPRGECTIDRIDVNGNYEPNNCRWVSMATQAKNKRKRQKQEKFTQSHVQSEDNESTVSSWFDTSWFDRIKTTIVKIDENELSAMDRDFRREFIEHGQYVFLTERKLEDGTYDYEVRYKSDKYAITAASDYLAEAKEKFLEMTKTENMKRLEKFKKQLCAVTNIAAELAMKVDELSKGWRPAIEPCKTDYKIIDLAGREVLVAVIG